MRKGREALGGKEERKREALRKRREALRKGEGREWIQKERMLWKGKGYEGKGYLREEKGFKGEG